MELTQNQPIDYDNEPQFGKIGLNMLPEDSEEIGETEGVDGEKQLKGDEEKKKKRRFSGYKGLVKGEEKVFEVHQKFRDQLELQTVPSFPPPSGPEDEKQMEFAWLNVEELVGRVMGRQIKQKMMEKGNKRILEFVEKRIKGEYLTPIEVNILLVAVDNDQEEEMHDLAYSLLTNPKKVRELDKAKEATQMLDYHLGDDGSIIFENGLVINSAAVSESMLEENNQVVWDLGEGTEKGLIKDPLWEEISSAYVRKCREILDGGYKKVEKWSGLRY